MVSVCGHIGFESHLHKMGSNCGSVHHKDGKNTDLDREARIIFVIFLTYTCTHHRIGIIFIQDRMYPLLGPSLS